jgi:hypothetical protein
MTFIVEMLRNIDTGKSPAEFRCDGESWNKLLAVAKKFGWQPKGTVPDKSFAKTYADYMDHFEPSYSPKEWALCKCLTDEDAEAMSVALNLSLEAIKLGNVSSLPETRSTMLSDNLNEEQLEFLNSSFTEIIQRFAVFSAGGGFVFAWDD